MIAILSAAVAPGFALLAFFYLKDRFEPEPFSMVFRMFILGALLVFPIMFIQYAFQEEGLMQSPFLSSFVTAATLEEFFKWFIFLYAIYKHTSFDGHYDGIVYGVSISLGFATVENILYLLAKGISFAFYRAFFPVSFHALIGVLMGYYMGKAKVGPPRDQFKILSVALIIPIIVHGSYDFVLEVWQTSWLFILVPFMIGLWFMALRKVKLANQVTADVISIKQNKKEA
ncbi:glutamic-type intramembrane protease PrsW [Pontibacillus salicampi]|uniref:Protease PrsW n=1 Tax=Pontibacillus salicampi TaxID=1449801 RepID=A0ABV6LLA0_9BACI